MTTPEQVLLPRARWTSSNLDKRSRILGKFHKKIYIAFSIGGSICIGAKQFHALYRVFSYSLMYSNPESFRALALRFPLSRYIIQENDGLIYSTNVLIGGMLQGNRSAGDGKFQALGSWAFRKGKKSSIRDME